MTFLVSMVTGCALASAPAGAPAGAQTLASCDTGTFSLSVASAMNAGASLTASIVRSGGSGAMTIPYSVSGVACNGVTGTASFADQDFNAKTFSVAGNGNGGTCLVALGPPAPTGTLGSPDHVEVVVSLPPPPPPPSGGGPCPATPIPVDAVATQIPFQGRNVLFLNNGQMGYAPLPTPSVGNGGVVQVGETTTSTSATIEMSINKCPAVIDTSLPACYVRSTNTSYVPLYFMVGPQSGINDAATAASYGICWASPASVYFVNIRYTYSASGTYGFAVQWNNYTF